MKSCEEFELLASLDLDGQATGEQRAELAEHLETCPACRAYAADIARLHRAFRRDKLVYPEGLSEQIMARVRATPQDRPEEPVRRKKPFPHWQRWAAAAACCALVAGIWAFNDIHVKKDTALISTDQAVPADMPAGEQNNMKSAAPAGPEADRAADGGTDPAARDNADQAIPEEHSEAAQDTVQNGQSEGDHRPLINSSPFQNLETVTGGEEAPASSEEPPGEEESPEAGEAPSGEAPPEAGSGDPDGENPDAVQPEDPNGQEDKAEPADIPEPSVGQETPETPDEPDEPDEPVEPVTVIGLPEPGVLIAAGSAAREWVENTLGLVWASGGSYPLTAEQYSDLLRTLDEAGEPYRVEPGEGYCLLSE